jgi:hypothetical protein
MADIKFKADCGYAPGSPFWTLLVDPEQVDGAVRFSTRDAAEAEAGLIARKYPGRCVHVLAVVATVQTSPEVVGERFDPRRQALPPAPPNSRRRCPRISARKSCSAR